LTGKNKGQPGFRIALELGEGVEFDKDVQSEQRGLVDDEQGLLFFGADQGVNLLADEPREDHLMKMSSSASSWR
jgi:hypothetical protein